MIDEQMTETEADRAVCGQVHRTIRSIYYSIHVNTRNVVPDNVYLITCVDVSHYMLRAIQHDIYIATSPDPYDVRLYGNNPSIGNDR